MWLFRGEYIGDSDIKGLNSAMGLPPVPYPTPVWWASVPTWWGGWKTLLPAAWCRVRTYRIFHPTYKQSEIKWNTTSTAIQGVQSYSTSIQFIIYGTNVWRNWQYECCDMPSTMYTLQMSQIPWLEFPWISHFYIINHCWAGSWPRVWVIHEQAFFLTVDFSCHDTLWASPTMCAQMQRIRRHQVYHEPTWIPGNSSEMPIVPTATQKDFWSSSQRKPITSSLHMVPHQSYAIIIYPCTSGLGLWL